MDNKARCSTSHCHWAAAASQAAFIAPCKATSPNTLLALAMMDAVLGSVGNPTWKSDNNFVYSG